MFGLVIERGTARAQLDVMQNITHRIVLDPDGENPVVIYSPRDLSDQDFHQILRWLSVEIVRGFEGELPGAKKCVVVRLPDTW